MIATIYNLDGKVKDSIIGIYRDAQFIYYAKGKGLIPVLTFGRAGKTEETIQCDYTRTYPTDQKKLGRMVYYTFNGKDYIQLGLKDLPMQTKELSLADYIAQYKLAQKTKESMIKAPSIVTVATILGVIAIFILLIGVGYVAQTNYNAVQLTTKNFNKTLNYIQATQTLLINQTQQLSKKNLVETNLIENLSYQLQNGVR
jgi:hypothetical protein